MIFVFLKYDNVNFKFVFLILKVKIFLFVINLVIIFSYKLEYIVLCYWFDLWVLRY